VQRSLHRRRTRRQAVPSVRHHARLVVQHAQLPGFPRLTYLYLRACAYARDITGSRCLQATTQSPEQCLLTAWRPYYQRACARVISRPRVSMLREPARYDERPAKTTPAGASHRHRSYDTSATQNQRSAATPATLATTRQDWPAVAPSWQGTSSQHHTKPALRSHPRHARHHLVTAGQQWPAPRLEPARSATQSQRSAATLRAVRSSTQHPIMDF
jgi:hypothetical protein